MASSRYSPTNGMVWLIAFFPAFAYYASTRMFYQSGLFGAVELGTPMFDTIRCLDIVDDNEDTLHEKKISNGGSISEKSACCNVLQEIVYLSSCHNKDASRNTFLLKYSMMNVDSVKSNVVNENVRGRNSYLLPSKIIDMEWVHDPAIGRGYLLYSVENRIWRWEKGGGPVAIGRTLHLDNAGCRSNLYQKCYNRTSITSRIGNNMMVGAIAIQKERIMDSKPVLSISEWGEGRIVRLESESGARTPLIIEVPDVCSNQYKNREQNDTNDSIMSPSMINRRKRLSYNPERMIYTRNGDLLVVIPCASNDGNDISSGASIVKLARATSIQPLRTLQMSRLAHSWSSMPDLRLNTSVDTSFPEVWFQSESIQAINGIVSGLNHDSVVLSVKYTNGTIAIIELPLEEILSPDETDDDNMEDSTSHQERKRLDSFPAINFLFNLTKLLSFTSPDSSVDEFPSYEIGDLVVAQSGTVFVALSYLNGPFIRSKILILKDNVGKRSSVVMSFIDLQNYEDFECMSRIISALELGTDGYLYVAVSTPALSRSDIYRLKTKEKRVE